MFASALRPPTFIQVIPSFIWLSLGLMTGALASGEAVHVRQGSYLMMGGASVCCFQRVWGRRVRCGQLRQFRMFH